MHDWRVYRFQHDDGRVHRSCIESRLCQQRGIAPTELAFRNLILSSHASPATVGNTAIAHDKICMMTTRLACNQAIESSYWRMDNNSDVGLLMGYVLYRLPIELESMDLDTFSN
jgi:hypothetical protein